MPKRLIALVTVLLALIAGCGGGEAEREDLAETIGDGLWELLVGELSGVAAAGGPSEAADEALELALDEVVPPTGVRRVARGANMSSIATAGYAGVSLPLVVVREDADSSFCMVFSLDSTGQLVAEPASGDPDDRCADTEAPPLNVP